MTPSCPPLLVVITGRPCTGKSTLAKSIAASLNLPLLAKDDIKERLFDHLGARDRAWSRRLGLATFDLMFYFMELQLSAAHSLAAEAPFYPRFHLEKFRQMQQRCPYQPFVIELVTESETLIQRFTRRSASGERHPGHMDLNNIPEFEALCRGEKELPLDLGGGRIEVDTSDFSRVDPAALAAAIRAACPQISA